MSHMWKRRCVGWQPSGALRWARSSMRTRVAVTSGLTSPGLFEVRALLGRERTVSRLERLVSFLTTRV
jgi:glutamyl/glutaminyl-tRNA synthetase